jgi:hypothetical protein
MLCCGSNKNNNIKKKHLDGKEIFGIVINLAQHVNHETFLFDSLLSSNLKLNCVGVD